MYGSGQSKYCYPGTDVLINLAGMTQQNQLDHYEKLVTYQRLSELVIAPMKGDFDLRHLCKIHHHIFGEVYPFAGKLREENISKGSFTFANTQYIEPEAQKLFHNLKEERHLVGIGREELPERLAYYMAEINVLHPFREGNGRVQREFTRTLALKAGYQLDWSKVPYQDVLQASIKSVSDLHNLKKVMNEAIVNDTPNQRLMKLVQKPIRSFDLER